MSIKTYCDEVRRLVQQTSELIVKHRKDVDQSAYIEAHAELYRTSTLDRAAAMSAMADPDVRKRIDDVDAALAEFVNESFIGQNSDAYRRAAGVLRDAVRRLEPFNDDNSGTDRGNGQFPRAESRKFSEVIEKCECSVTKSLLNAQFIGRTAGKTMETINREFLEENGELIDRDPSRRAATFASMKRNARNYMKEYDAET